MKKLALCALVLLLLCSLLSGCGTDKRIYGTWETEAGDRGFGFGEDGQGYLSFSGLSAPFAYAIKGNRLIISLGEEGNVRTDKDALVYGITFFGDDEFCLELPPDSGQADYYYRVVPEQ